MTTKNPRINVTFDETMAGLLSGLAQQEHQSVASLVRELTREALEQREDLYLSKLAEKLDQPNALTLSHDDVWK